jgi:hypothetical protein
MEPFGLRYPQLAETAGPRVSYALLLLATQRVANARSGAQLMAYDPPPRGGGHTQFNCQKAVMVGQCVRGGGRGGGLFRLWVTMEAAIAV